MTIDDGCCICIDSERVESSYAEKDCFHGVRKVLLLLVLVAMPPWLHEGPGIHATIDLVRSDDGDVERDGKK